MSNNTFKIENIKTVLRTVSTDLIQECFENKKLFQDINFKDEKNKLKKDFVDFVIEKIESIETISIRNKIKYDLHRVFVMGNEKAIMPFIRRRNSIGEQIVSLIKSTNNNYEKSFILFLNCEADFDDFYLIHQAENYNSKWWDIRSDYSSNNVELNDDLVDDVVKEAEKYLINENRAKKYCKKVITIADKEYIFAFYEDFPVPTMEIKDGIGLEMKFLNPVNDIVFMYDKKHKFVNICAKDATIRKNMHKLFAKTVFKKEDIPEEQVKNEICDTVFAFEQMANDGNIHFEIDDKSNIIKVVPILIKLQMKEDNSMMELKAGKKNGEYCDLYNSLKNWMMLESASKNTIAPEDVNVLWIKFVIYYRDSFNKDSVETKEVKITNGNKISSLGDEDIDFEIIDCFKDSRIIKIGSDDK
jgi:hypothetical protein